MSLIFLPNLTNVGLTCWSEPIIVGLTSLSDLTNMDLICLSYQLKLESDIFNIINKFEKNIITIEKNYKFDLNDKIKN
jgi:hypothetical protein